MLTLFHKNEARRLITLLDALYEARCKLLISAEAGPDDIFFPETKAAASSPNFDGTSSGNEVYSETFSEIYQDSTSPFRPNISSYTSSASKPSYEGTSLLSSLNQSTAARSILADEDSDFGPTYGAGRNRGPGDGAPGAGNEIGRHHEPDFARVGSFIGEDEKFAFKRAESRIWEMCGAKWWSREGDDWWRPLSKEVRRWEGEVGGKDILVSNSGLPVEAAKNHPGEELFRHGASPFRTSEEAPPKFGWQQ